MELFILEGVAITSLILSITSLFISTRLSNKNMLMNHSSQVVISKYTVNFDSCEDRFSYPYKYKVNVKNVGRGYIVKAFILLTVPKKDKLMSKEIFLSKPIVGLETNEDRNILLTLRESDVEGLTLHHEKIKFEVIYQDSLNNIFIINLNRQNNEHLRSFDKLPTKLRFIKRIIYNKKIKKSKTQGNDVSSRLAKIQSELGYLKVYEIVEKDK